MRFTRTLVVAVVFGLALFLGPTQVAVGATLTVNSTADTTDGACDLAPDCTLREAILASNASVATFDTIAFSITGAGPHTITPGTALPTITDPVLIDGTSEPDFVTTPVIELDGTGAGASVDGLRIAAGSSTVKGLVINRFDGDGIEIVGTLAIGNTIEGNYIGTNVAGTAALGNTLSGVRISGAVSNTIGPGNVISGNGGDGVFVFTVSVGANLNTVLGNYIGTNAAGTAAIGNSDNGVFILTGPSNTVGPGNIISGNGLDGVFIAGGAVSNTIGPGNVISGNSSDGVQVTGVTATGNAITGNSIHDNTGLGIDNVSGGNTELTPPTVTAVGSASGSSDCASCTIEVFSDAADEGKTFHGTTTTAAGACPCAWSFPGAVTGPNITATVTDGSGNTSEFSGAFVADTDGDGVLDANDNCPTIATLWIVPPDDPDCDGFTTADEIFYGTDPFSACAADTTANNEPGPDKWPVDLNDTTVVTTADVGFFIVPLNSFAPGPPYSVRLDFNKDGLITTADVGFFIAPLNQTCPS